jgi:hypothetical protein
MFCVFQAVYFSDTFLSIMYLSAFSVNLPFCAYLLDLRTGSHSEIWSIQRRLAGVETHFVV